MSAIVINTNLEKQDNTHNSEYSSLPTIQETYQSLQVDPNTKNIKKLFHNN